MDGDVGVTHAFVVRPDGMYVDIEGVHEHDTYCEKWKERGVMLHGDRIEDPVWAGTDFGPYSYRRARQLAPLVATQP